MDPYYVFAEDPQCFSVNYADDGDPQKRQEIENGWKKFTRRDPATGQNLLIWFRETHPTSQVNIDYRLPPGAPAGRYRVEAYIPGIHATTRAAIFTIANPSSSAGQTVLRNNTPVVVNMLDLYDIWYPLGEFDIDPSVDPLSGRVRQFDLSLEDPPKEISFGPIRWAPVENAASNGYRFDSPVGSRAERQSPLAQTGTTALGQYPLWNGSWFDYNPYLSWYRYGYHTGADLNLTTAGDEDRGQAVYAAGEGVVIYAGKAPNWGTLVVIEHPEARVALPQGSAQVQKVYTRYGHLEFPARVRPGQAVMRGQMIGRIGQAQGWINGWHLHFDVCYTDLLKRQPAHWPDLQTIQRLRANQVAAESRQYQAALNALKREVIQNYLDPLAFLRENHSSCR